MTNSRQPRFHNLTRAQRLARTVRATGLSKAQHQHLTDAAAAEGELADNLSENVIGVMALPLSIATNLVVDGQDVLVPMVSEESSVVAAVCNGALACRDSGGVTTGADEPEMIAQVQITALPDIEAARATLLDRRDDIAALCDACDPVLVRLGGGFRGLEIRRVADFLVLHLIIDVRDAMGANTVNTMAEAVAPHVQSWSGGRVGLRILSNLANRRLVRARATWPAALLGSELLEAMLSAHHFAAHDPYRAATHNKGIMNGVTAVGLATGNDTRALEAGAHAYAATKAGTAVGYGPLTHWQKTASGDLTGQIELPMPVGIVGGATKAHPTAQASLKIIGATSAGRLGRIMAAVGLVQNFSAMRALAGEGIQRGHMGLHARNVAIATGASGAEIDLVARELISRGTVREEVARKIRRQLQAGDKKFS